jgi:hypothetical protein
MAADRVIRWTTARAVVGVAAIAAMASYEHAYDLVRAHGEAGWTARLVPLTVDGLTYASSMVMLDSARRKVPVPALARWLLGLGIAVTLAANVAHGLGHGLAGAVVAAWPARYRNGKAGGKPGCVTGGDERPYAVFPGRYHVEVAVERDRDGIPAGGAAVGELGGLVDLAASPDRTEAVERASAGGEPTSPGTVPPDPGLCPWSSSC